MGDASDSGSRGQPPSVILYKKERCPLCDEALEVIHAEARRSSFTLAVQDITHDPGLLAQYGHEIPVVLIDGTKRFFGRVDPVLFRRAVDRRR
jgi:hypothetical protein